MTPLVSFDSYLILNVVPALGPLRSRILNFSIRPVIFIRARKAMIAAVSMGGHWSNYCDTASNVQRNVIE
jgi:hypothetical protein